jgi:chitodextrinase
VILNFENMKFRRFYILLIVFGAIFSCIKFKELATLTTTATTSIGLTTAISGGNITAEGGGAITARGTCWATTTEPTISNSKTTDGTGTGSFTSNITGLTPGTKYYIRAYTTNNAGTAYGNEVSFTTLILGPPTNVLATAGNAQATVIFTAPASNGGSAITGYTVTSNPGGITGTGSSSPITVTGLTNGTSYTFTVVAVNINGNSSPSSPSNSVTPSAPSTVPSAPTIGTATAGNAQAIVTFTAPASNGGSAITGYTATSNPGGFTGTGSSSPITVTGLTNGTSYTFTVIATNANGNSLPSSASNSVTPSAVPGAPTIGTATSGNTQATITFTAPGSNGGSAILSYTVTSIPGGITGTGTASPITITGLTNGTTYTFTVVATNANGNSLPSSASNSVTPSVPSTVPGAPTIGTATKGNAQATVTFTAPGSNGGSAITGYTVTSSPGGITATGSASPITITGLTNGTAYTFTVTATNANGIGPVSPASNSVTPSAVPGAPTIGTATKGNAQAIVTFTAPGSNGGSAIIGYTVTSSPGGITAAGSTSPIIVTGLTNGTAYTFTVIATNVNGTGSASSASNSVTPSTVPGAPTIGTATAGNAQATITFNAPGSNGGSAITGYTVTSSPGGITGTGTGSPITVTGLTIGTSYTFTVIATNANGNSTASAASNSVVSAISIGDTYQGGIVAYILQSGDPGYISGETHGLIAAPTDQSTGIQWYNGSYTTTGATGTALGTGMANTNTIVSNQGVGSYAAKLCYDLILGGYSDWYLPSNDELNKLYLNKAVVGGFGNNLYWSSTEQDSHNAWGQIFENGEQYSQYRKYYTQYVRAVRTF